MLFLCVLFFQSSHIKSVQVFSLLWQPNKYKHSIYKHHGQNCQVEYIETYFGVWKFWLRPCTTENGIEKHDRTVDSYTRTHFPESCSCIMGSRNCIMRGKSTFGCSWIGFRLKHEKTHSVKWFYLQVWWFDVLMCSRQ